MRAPRSIVFYAWLGLVVEFALVLGVVAFVLAGAAYQRSAILLLSQRIQHMQVANLTLRSEFLNHSIPDCGRAVTNAKKPWPLTGTLIPLERPNHHDHQRGAGLAPVADTVTSCRWWSPTGNAGPAGARRRGPRRRGTGLRSR